MYLFTTKNYAKPTEILLISFSRGAVGGIVPFFGDLGFKCPSYHNPADYIMEVASGEYGPCVDTLVAAVEDGKCDRKELEFAATRQSENHEISGSRNGNGINKSSSIHDSAEGNGGCTSNSTAVNLDPITNSTVVKIQNCQNTLLGSSESLDDHCHSFPTSSWTQFRVLFIRTFFSIIRDETLTKLRIISHIAIGLLLGMYITYLL